MEYKKDIGTSVFNRLVKCKPILEEFTGFKHMTRIFITKYILSYIYLNDMQDTTNSIFLIPTKDLRTFVDNIPSFEKAPRITYMDIQKIINVTIQRSSINYNQLENTKRHEKVYQLCLDITEAKRNKILYDNL